VGLTAALLSALLVTAALTPVAATAARRLGVIDRPGPLKVHQEAVPYLGGVAVFAGVAAPVALERPSWLLPLALALVLGVADDVVDIPTPIRLLAEVVVAVTVVATVEVRGPLAALVVCAGSVILLNAVNLLDGLDGLASGVAAVAALGFAAVLEDSGQVLGLALAGALVGFLLWNRPPARIYLGDGGSYLVGTTLAVLFASTAEPGAEVSLTAGAALFLAVPVADTTVAIVRRWRAHRPLLAGDRGHVYDQLVDRGWSPSRTLVACVAAQAVLVVVGIGITALFGPVAVAVAAAVILGIGATLLWAFTSPTAWAEAGPQ
jgi:UDP-GlcNAc:undecaprenyl-phosphate GlcNAc-1-phosphate transferase